MKLEWIVFIVIVCFWLLILLVSGVLALIYHFQHTPLIKQRNQYYKEWDEIKNNVNLKQILKNPLEVNFKLPISEKIYYLDIDVPIYVYSKKTKEYKSIIKMDGFSPNLYENYFDDLDIINLKSGFSLFKKTFKLPLYTANLYISNFRVMINDLSKNKSHQIPLTKIHKAYISMIYQNKDYTRGFVIQTDDELYEIVSTEPQAVLIINELLRKEIKKNERDKLGEN